MLHGAMTGWYLAVDRPGLAPTAGTIEVVDRGDGPSIADVLRVRMYAEDYGDARMARDEYVQIGEPAVACLSCETRACARACPYGLPIPELTRGVAMRLA